MLISNNIKKFFFFLVLKMIPLQYRIKLQKKWGSKISDEDLGELLNSYTINEVEQNTILNVEQRTDAWFQYRKNRVTASNFSAANKNNPYCSRRKLIQRILYPEPISNPACEWGTRHEKDAVDVFTQYLHTHIDEDAKITFPGLIVSLQYPFLGVSPDGLVSHVNASGERVLFGLEIKCPFRKKIYPSIPRYYYDQIQGTMGLLGLKYYYFVVWTPSETRIELFQFDEHYFQTILLPNLLDFFYVHLVPEIILKHKKEQNNEQKNEQATAGKSDVENDTRTPSFVNWWLDTQLIEETESP